MNKPTKHQDKLDPGRGKLVITITVIIVSILIVSIVLFYDNRSFDKAVSIIMPIVVAISMVYYNIIIARRGKEKR